MTHIIRTFPSIRVALMVGIGCGVPDKASIHLGGIVVGAKVVQHDPGKIIGNGHVQRTADPKSLNYLLGTAVSLLRAEHEQRNSRVPFIMEEKLAEYIEYRRPTTADCLFSSTYDHTSSASS